MELSVSGFPEPLRQGSAESDSESSRLRGLFGKKADLRPSILTSSEAFMPVQPSPRSLPTTPSEEHDAYAHMVLSAQEPIPPVPQRQRKVSTPRNASQVKKQSSGGRLEYAPTVSASPIKNPKPLTPSPQDSSADNTKSQRRPLPIVPSSASIVESKKMSAPRPVPQQLPPSSVLISTPPRPRAHTAVSVRYQPLAVNVDTKEPKCSPSPGSATGGPVRRLPGLPASAVNPTTPVPLSRHIPRPTRVKRPSSSSGASNTFNPNGRRSPFDSIPSSWASRPVDLNPTHPPRSLSAAQRSSSSSRAPSAARPLPTIQVAQRARSHSRPRYDQSSSGARTPISSSPRQTRMLSPVSLASTSSSSSPSRTSVRTSRTLSSPSTPASSPLLPLTPSSANRSLSTPLDPPAQMSTLHSTIGKEAIVSDLSASASAPLHVHPVERLSADEQRSDPEWRFGLEPYIDDEDHSSMMSRSPSPMRYARPNSRGSLSSLSDDSSDYSRSRSRAVRDQLRSYRRSYRGPKSPSRSPSPMQYARRTSLDGLDEISTDLSPKRRGQPRSYQFDYKAAQESSPFITPPDRRSSDDISKSNSSKSNSIRTRRGRSKSSRHSRSRSPSRWHWPRTSSPAGSVLDISVSSAHEQQKTGRPSSEHKRTGRSISHIDSRGSLPVGASGGTSAWRTGGSWDEVSKAGTKQWIDLYKDDNAVVVTTIQPTKDAWKEDMKRLFRG